jgi:hypothetical protein
MLASAYLWVFWDHTMGLWTWIRGIGGNPEEEADPRRGGRRGGPRGKAEERFLEGSGYAGGPSGISYGGGLAAGEAAEVAKADLDETRPQRDPAP